MITTNALDHKKPLELLGSDVAVAHNLGHEAWTNDFPRVDRDDRRATVRVAEKVMAPLHSRHLEPGALKGRNDFPVPEALEAEPSANGDFLDADKIERLQLVTLSFKAQLNGFANADHQLVQRTSPGYGTPLSGNGTHVETFSVALADHIELSGHVSAPCTPYSTTST